MRKTKKERVLARLQDADGQWVCSRTLHHPNVGGRRAGGRIFDLRKDGHEIETLMACVCDQCRSSHLRSLQRNEPPTRVAAYRLVAREQVTA